MTGMGGPEAELVLVRAIGIDQLEAVEAVMAAAFDPAYGEAWNAAQVLATLAMPGYRLRGAFSAGIGRELAGFAISRIVAGESELLLLGVDPAWRRRGVATALMQDWIDLCHSQHVELAFLEMREDNPARALYRQFGFADAALRKAYYRGADGVMRNAVTMKKTLMPK